MKLFILALLSACAGAQTFNSGSTGADGALVIGPSPTVPPGTQVVNGAYVVPLREPPNHIYNFTTITIAADYHIRFTANKANTPAILLASGNVTVDGWIDLQPCCTASLLGSVISNKGGPGGFSGGMSPVPSCVGCPSSAGNGPGAGTGLVAPTSVGTPEIQPLIGGSGGGGLTFDGQNGGAGGGALLIASSGTIDLGGGLHVISADGQPVFPPSIPPPIPADLLGTGSGGAIRLVATIIKGSAILSANPAGRIRLEAAQSNQYNGQATPAATFNQPGQPIVLFPPVVPALRILSIGGVAVPAQATGEVAVADLALPSSLANPVPVMIEADHVPSGTQARVFVRPQFGGGPQSIVTVTLTGSVGQPKHATANVTLPAGSVGIISAVIDSVLPEL